MKRTLFFILIILGLFSCEKKEIQKGSTEVPPIEFRDGEEESIVSAEITEHQLLGEPNDYAHIEFSVGETDGELITFELYIDSQTDFLASFLISEEDEDDWSIENIDLLDQNIFSFQLESSPPPPDSSSVIVQEEIICIRQICNPCTGIPPADCVILEVSNVIIE